MRESSQHTVFLCHNSKDKYAVEHIASLLEANGLSVWLDAWNIRPGSWWTKELEHIIKTCDAVAVFLGASGVGRWQDLEISACLNQMVNRNLRVIPVLLPGLESSPDLPVFLQGLEYVDYRKGLHSHRALRHLTWAITGKEPHKVVLTGKTMISRCLSLPEPVPHFVNRMEELNKAAKSLLSRQPFIIYGVPGIGKSALAVKIARDLASGASFPGGVYWCDVAGHADLEQVTHVIVGALDVDDITQGGPARQLQLLARHVSEHDAMLVLDNVLDPVVAESIIRGFQNTALLLTTRAQPPSQPIDVRKQTCDLQELSQDDAAVLLLRVSGEQESGLDGLEMQQAKGICDVVGGHPMAVTILGSAKWDEVSTFAAIRKEWREILRENDFNRMFQVAYDRVGKRNHDAQAVFRYVSIFPGSFCTGAVDEVTAATSVRVVRKLLKELLRWSLISRVKEERFRLHDLLREFGRARLVESGDESVVVDRYVKYYRVHLGTIRANSEELQMEGDNILSAFDYSRRAGDASSAVALADGLNLYLNRIGALKKRCQLWRQCVDLCRRSGSPSLAYSLWRYSRSLRSLGKLAQFKVTVDEALEKARECEDTRTEAGCLWALTGSHLSKGNMSRAEAVAIEGLRKARQSSDREIERMCLRGLADVRYHQGRLEEVIEILNQALQFSRATGVADEIADDLAALGNALARLDKLHDARHAVEEALALARRCGSVYMESFRLFDLGVVLDKLGQHQDALQYYMRSLAIRKKMRAINHVGTCLHAVGHCKARLGNLEEAERFFRRSLKIKLALDEPRGAAPSLEWLGRVAAERGDMRQAKEYACRSLKLYESLGSSQAEEVRKLLAQWSR